ARRRRDARCGSLCLPRRHRERRARVLKVLRHARQRRARPSGVVGATFGVLLRGDRLREDPVDDGQNHGEDRQRDRDLEKGKPRRGLRATGFRLREKTPRGPLTKAEARSQKPSFDLPRKPEARSPPTFSFHFSGFLTIVTSRTASGSSTSQYTRT